MTKKITHSVTYNKEKKCLDLKLVVLGNVSETEISDYINELTQKVNQKHIDLGGHGVIIDSAKIEADGITQNIKFPHGTTKFIID